MGLLLAFGQVLAWRKIAGGRWREGADESYDRLANWGRRLGRPVAAGDTPRAYAAAVIAAAGRIASADPRGRLAPAGAVVQAEVTPLAETFEAALYGGAAAAAGEMPEEGRGRAALWSALRRLWLARKLIAG